MSAAAEEFQQVTPDVIFWQAYEPEVKVELCSCAVRGSTGWVLVDPIPLSHGAMAELNELIEPAAILLSNGNHARAAADFRKRYGVSIVAHPDAVPELETDVDETIEEGNVVGGDLSIISLPGAAAGEIALHSPRGSLHIGDALINLEAYGFIPLLDKYCRDPKELRRSLAKLVPLEFTVLTFAHGLPIVSQARTRLFQLLA